MTESEQAKRAYYKSQAIKRLNLVYRYAHTDLVLGKITDPYLLFRLAGVDSPRLFTNPERRAWSYIRKWRRGYSFWPEYKIGNDFVDFADPQHMIVIEIDSSLHNKEKDAAKDQRLHTCDYSVLRFSDHAFSKSISELDETLDIMLQQHKFVQAKKLDDDINNHIETKLIDMRESKKIGENGKNSKISLVRFSEVSESKAFKLFQKKYITEVPLFLRDQINFIPLELIIEANEEPIR